jgi:hypothetical protein
VTANVSNVRLPIENLRAQGSQARDWLANRIGVTNSTNSQVTVFPRQGLSDAKTDSPRASGNQRDAFHD